MKKRIAIFISGRGSNMDAILRQTREGILREACEVVLVFSNKSDARGLQTAIEAGIETACIPSKGKKRENFDQEVIKFLESYKIDFIVLAGYMRLLSPGFIQAYKQRIINIHPADTKAFQGVGGYDWAFENKLKETFVTVHYVDEGVDTGVIIEQRKLNISDCPTLEEIKIKGLALEHKMFSEVLKKIFENEQ
ncbi:MAG: phosphoribosylglycinamide formyltransferase [Candidatus Marinimicrobia bacterium]|nr:phosphoribosylglycinamide formyltransferase [Candidatus Neomarinimicrobiota bacterium]